MILIDTSVWIDFFRERLAKLDDLLAAEDVFIHPFVLGEIAIGPIRDRKQTLYLLKKFPEAVMAKDSEVLMTIDRWALFNKGLGYVDAHLLCSVSLMPGCRLWTRDKSLHAAAVKLGLEMTPS